MSATERVRRIRLQMEGLKSWPDDETTRYMRLWLEQQETKWSRLASRDLN